MKSSLISVASYFLPQGVSLAPKNPPALLKSLVTAKVVDVIAKRFSTLYTTTSLFQTIFCAVRNLTFIKATWARSLIIAAARLCLRARAALNVPIPPLELTPEQFIEHLKSPDYKFPNCEIIVFGDLELGSETINVNNLPPNLHVKGRLNLKGRTDLISLPPGLHTESLDLDNCTGLTSLPPDLRVERDLHARNCISLISLPPGLHVRCLNLYGCTGLTSLPSGLRVEEDLHLGGCTGLISLPRDLRVEEDLHLGGCTSLISLPRGLRVRGDLDLDGCAGLTSLPPDLDVKGSLYLNDCIGLTFLPLRLRVREDLHLSGCTGLTFLPSDLDVERDLALEGCTGLTSLPDWIAQLGPTSKGYIRVVRLAGISKSVIDEFKKRNTPTAPGMQFYFSHLDFASRFYGTHPLPLKSGQ